MPTAVVLAVSFDSSLLANLDSVWQSAGYHLASGNAAKPRSRR
jgi:hypothetical protein